ncbi:hypothetical protein GCM10007036_09230 [Alsobacter metallidurans]|uniref:Uncharacterized protein n=1 Tax=Alsobacter metallidurans TaxID=340221 RepID=A0A917I3Y5_9HYPH|nr:hypothetical protein GCM10007036_09230 [Alsobacter metallidurans]
MRLERVGTSCRTPARKGPGPQVGTRIGRCKRLLEITVPQRRLAPGVLAYALHQLKVTRLGVTSK